MLLGEAKNFLCHFRKIGVFKHQTSQRVSAPRIEAGRDDDQIGRKSSLDVANGISERLPVLSSRCAGGQRNIQCEPFSFAASPLTGRTGTGIIRILMRRKIENSWILPEDFLRAVTVMDIPVDDQNTFDAVLRLSVACADSCVVEKAKSHCGRNRRVVPRRTNETKCPAALFSHGSIDGGDRRARRESRHRSEEHTSELQSQSNLVCRLLLEKKKKIERRNTQIKKTYTFMGTRNA